MKYLLAALLLTSAPALAADNLYACNDGVQINLAMTGDATGTHAMVYFNGQKMYPSVDGVQWGSKFTAYADNGTMYLFDLEGSQLTVSRDDDGALLYTCNHLVN